MLKEGVLDSEWVREFGSLVQVAVAVAGEASTSLAEGFRPDPKPRVVVF
jgi:hypothetical protein